MSAKRVRPVSKTPPATEVTRAAEPEPEWVTKLAALGRSPLGFILASILVLLPCYWQAHIQAGDLSSHIYNSWLAQLTEAGKLPGLIVAHPATKLLFDQILSGL